MSKEMAKRENDATAMVRDEFAGAISEALSSAAVQEIQGAMVLAKQFPRDEHRSRQLCIESCKLPSFAAIATYKYPIGGKQISGISVGLAKEIARCLGDFRYGSYTLHDDDEQRVIRCWAWDLQSRVKSETDVPFKKVVWRKDGDDGGFWKPVDERELLALNNNHRARGIRNCILELVSPVLKEAVLEVVRATMLAEAKKDPKALLRSIIDGFGEKGVTPDELRDFTQTDPEKLTPQQLTYLQEVLNGLREGAPWTSFLDKMAAKKGVAEDGPVSSAAELKKRVMEKAAEAKKKKKDKEPAAGDPEPAKAETKTKPKEAAQQPATPVDKESTATTPPASSDDDAVGSSPADNPDADFLDGIE